MNKDYVQYSCTVHGLTSQLSPHSFFPPHLPLLQVQYVPHYGALDLAKLRPGSL